MLRITTYQRDGRHLRSETLPCEPVLCFADRDRDRDRNRDRDTDAGGVAAFTRSHSGETVPVGFYNGLRGVGVVPGRDVAVIGARPNPAIDALQPALTCFTRS